MLAFTREWTFSSKKKRLTGGNMGLCSSEEIVVLTEPKEYAGEGIPNTDDFPLSRSLGNWSEDGRLLLYQEWKNSGPRIWDAEVGESQALEGLSESTTLYYTSLSPNGDYLAYYDYVDDEIYLRSVADGEVTLLSTDNEEVRYSRPQFSPDGTAILFEIEGGLQVYNLEWDSLTNIATDLRVVTYEYEGIGSSHVINEFGENLIYPFPDSPAAQAGLLEGDVILAIEGETVTPDTDYISLLRGAAGTEVNVLVERKGEELAFTITRDVITSYSEGYLEDYIWTPEGNSVVYEVWIPSGESVLRIHDLKSGTVTKVVSVASDIWDLRTSPDGRWLSFTSDFEGNDEIYAVPSHGGAIVNLTRHPADDYDPVWIP
jgi:Tol biopolymer transport system component